MRLFEISQVLQRQRSQSRCPNVGTPERAGSAIVGLALFSWGVKCRGVFGGILTLRRELFSSIVV